MYVFTCMHTEILLNYALGMKSTYWLVGQQYPTYQVIDSEDKIDIQEGTTISLHIVVVVCICIL